MAQFRHEEIAAVPSGYHVRTIHSGEHQIRAAFPPGRRKKGSGVLVSILHPAGENPSRCKNAHSSVYSYAVSLGYPYLRGEGRVAEDGRTWLSRVTKKEDGSGGAIFVGWDSIGRKWIIEREGKNNGASKAELQRAARERAGQIRKARLSRGPRFRDVGLGNPDPASYTYSIVYKSPETGRTLRTGGYWRKDAERIAEYMRGMLKKKYGKRVSVEVKPDKRSLVDRLAEKVFRNPEDQIAEATRLYETFHGREPIEVLKMHESAEQSGDYTGLGDLVELVFIAPNGDEVLVKFNRDGVRVASSPDGDRAQLYFFGGNQDISGQLNLFGIEDTGKVLLDLGEAKRIVYEAAKWQTDFTDQEWKHNFGEESGVRPRAFFRQSRGESDPARIFLAGGNYRIERGGIVD